MALVHGDLVFKLDLRTLAALGLPGDYQAYWRGSPPSNVDGSRVHSVVVSHDLQ